MEPTCSALVLSLSFFFFFLKKLSRYCYSPVIYHCAKSLTFNDISINTEDTRVYSKLMLGVNPLPDMPI